MRACAGTTAAGTATHARRLCLAAVLACVAGTSWAKEPDPRITLLARREAVDTVVSRCVTAFPALAPQLTRDREEWRARNADALADLESLLASLPADNRQRLDTMMASMRSGVNDQFEVVIAKGEGEAGCRGAVASFGDTRSAYYDAESYGEATGMYHAAELGNEEFANQCRQWHPDLEPTIVAAVATWRERDAVAARATAEAFARLRSEDAAAVAKIESSIREPMRNMLAQLPPGQTKAFCTSHFASLAAGDARKNTPKMYQFLENGRPAD